MNLPPAVQRSAWPLAAAMIALPAVGVGVGASTMLDWQPALAGTQPWRAFTGAWVHYSQQHLWANLAGSLAVALLGIAARAPARLAAAWLAAWPLTQVLLLAQPTLTHFGGLSGVLHAGVALCALHIVSVERGDRRGVGAALLAGLLIKVLLEAPWGPALRTVAGWDIAIAPAAHAAGVVVGVLGFVAASALTRPRAIQSHG